MRDELRQYAFVHFMCATSARAGNVTEAARLADAMLVEFDKRFYQQCAACAGSGKVSRDDGVTTTECGYCSGSGLIEK